MPPTLYSQQHGLEAGLHQLWLERQARKLQEKPRRLENQRRPHHRPASEADLSGAACSGKALSCAFHLGKPELSLPDGYQLATDGATSTVRVPRESLSPLAGQVLLRVGGYLTNLCWMGALEASEAEYQ